MGSRGAFINFDENDFTFKLGSQIYRTIGYEDGIKYIIQDDHKNGKKLPDYSHSDDAIYALIARDKVIGFAIYNNHIKVSSVDLDHKHKNKDGKEFKNYVHMDLYHKEDARELNEHEINILGKILNGAKKYL